MKPIIRNFLSVIRRFKMAVALNILGLSVAFAAFMIIMIQLNYDFGFDKFHRDYDKIFRVEYIQNATAQTIICRPLAEIFIESSPHILFGAITQFLEGKARFHAEGDDISNIYEENSLIVTPSFFDVFTFDFVEGSKDDFGTPEKIIIPLSLSRKLFGNEQAVGKQIVHSDRGNQTVMAVYRDFPANSIVNNCIYFAMLDSESKNNWQVWSYITYIRVNDAAYATLLFDNFKQNNDATIIWGAGSDWDETGISMRLTALPDIHYVKNVQYDNTPKTSKQTLMILFAIAMMIVAIAAINFTNFSTALTPMRIKNINTQRVLGAQRNTLSAAIAFEAVAVSFLSYLIAILLFLFFNTTPFANLVVADLSVAANPLTVVGTAVLALLVGVIAGLYPAFYITSFAPALVLKGSFGLSPKGKIIRTTLIGIQFIASLALIIGTSFMYLQNNFMQNSPLNYDKDELITVNTRMIQSNRDAFINQLKTYSGIEDVTYGDFLLSSRDSYMGWAARYKGENIRFQSLPVHYTFLKVMGIEVTEGRDFSSEDAGMQKGVFVFNETARRQYNLEVSTSIDNYGEIIGFMPDVKFASFRNTVEPMAFFVWGTRNWGDRANETYIRVKAGADKRTAMSHVRTTLAEFNVEYPFNVCFYDEILQRLYEKEIAFNTLITLFSLIAIFISIVGVFGLVVFDSECRRKEIGIRKILGASTIGIIIMFNKAYFRILAVCFVIAAPLAWYAVTRWLENFAYKTPMFWWVYLLAFVVVGIITVATVTFQNWRVANDDPVNAIKME